MPQFFIHIVNNSRQVLILILLFLSSFIFSTSLVKSCRAQEWQIFHTDNSNIPDNYALSIAIDEYNNSWIGTKYGGLAKYDGKNWEVFLPDVPPLAINPTGNYNQFALSGPQVNALYAISIDGNNTKWIGTKIGGLLKFNEPSWELFNSENSPLPYDRVWSVELDQNGNKWLGTVGGGLAFFDNYEWTIFDTQNSALPHNEVWGIKIDKSNVKWIATSAGLAKFDDVFWEIFDTTNSPLPVNTIWSIEVDAENNKWIGTKGGGLVKYDNDNWIIFNSTDTELPDNNIWTIAIDSTGNKWLGTINGGVVKFDNFRWEIFNTENSVLLNNTIWDIEVDHNNNVWIGTNYGLAFYQQDSITTNIAASKSRENCVSFNLKQNFPNPFNSSTSILFQVNYPTQIKIRIYDINGKHVRNLFNGFRKTGTYKIIWDGTDDKSRRIVSGLYFCKMTDGNQVSVRKVTLLR